MTDSRLPTPGSAVEKNRLDCKAKYDDGDKRRFEMAKDVAAFANANGGRLLIGSIEHGGLLIRHVGLPKAEATKTRRDIEEAVRDWIRPSPVIEFPEWVAVDDDNVVLIVDVQPFPGQAVGVRLSKEDGAGWVFPVRVGTQTVRYSPEQLVLLMDVVLRRKVQSLSLAKQSGEVWITMLPSTNEVYSGDEAARAVVIDEIDEAGNAVRVSAKGFDTWIPLDAIDNVWRAGSHWTVKLHGHLWFNWSGSREPSLDFYEPSKAVR